MLAINNRKRKIKKRKRKFDEVIKGI